MTDVTDMILHQLNSVDAKLDRVAALAERVASVEEIQTGANARIKTIESDNKKFAIEMAEIRGKNKIIGWILGLLGAPLLVGLCLIGLRHLFS